VYPGSTGGITTDGKGNRKASARDAEYVMEKDFVE
jgi:hypothetical protein